MISIHGYDDIDNMTAENEILVGLEQRCDTICLQGYDLTMQDLSLLYRKIKETQPGLYYVDPTYAFTYDSSGKVYAVMPSYQMSIDEIRLSRNQIKDMLEHFTRQTESLLSDGDKALYIHDFLARNFKYSPADAENYDIYAMLKTGHGVCQAFSLLFVLLGHSIGLEADMVTSLPMDHAWNHVKIDGFYYHIDVTRDLANIPGDQAFFSHDRFLLCDDALKQKGYHDYGCHGDHSCGSTLYQVLSHEDRFISAFSHVVGSALYLGKEWLAVDKDGVPCHITLFYEKKDTNYISYTVDLNEDGKFSLSDILHPEIQNAPEAAQAVTEALRKYLLKQAAEGFAGIDHVV